MGSCYPSSENFQPANDSVEALLEVLETSGLM